MKCNSHTHLTETPSFAWYVAAALKPLPYFALVRTNNGFNCSVVSVYQNKPESTKILIISIIKEDRITMKAEHTVFPRELKMEKIMNFASCHAYTKQIAINLETNK